MFTENQIREIHDKLLRLQGIIKDSEFQLVDKIKQNDTVVIVQDGVNKNITLEDLSKYTAALQLSDDMKPILDDMFNDYVENLNGSIQALREAVAKLSTDCSCGEGGNTGTGGNQGGQGNTGTGGNNPGSSDTPPSTANSFIVRFKIPTNASVEVTNVRYGTLVSGPTKTSTGLYEYKYSGSGNTVVITYRITKDGYDPITGTVTLNKGYQTIEKGWNVATENKTSVLRITANPTDADVNVSLDRSYINTDHTVSNGVHTFTFTYATGTTLPFNATVTVSKDGYISKTKSYEITEGVQEDSFTLLTTHCTITVRATQLGNDITSNVYVGMKKDITGVAMGGVEYTEGNPQSFERGSTVYVKVSKEGAEDKTETVYNISEDKVFEYDYAADNITKTLQVSVAPSTAGLAYSSGDNPVSCVNNNGVWTVVYTGSKESYSTDFTISAEGYTTEVKTLTIPASVAHNGTHSESVTLTQFVDPYPGDTVDYVTVTFNVEPSNVAYSITLPGSNNSGVSRTSNPNEFTVHSQAIPGTFNFTIEAPGYTTVTKSVTVSNLNEPDIVVPVNLSETPKAKIYLGNVTPTDATVWLNGINVTSDTYVNNPSWNDNANTQGEEDYNFFKENGYLEVSVNSYWSIKVEKAGYISHSSSGQIKSSDNMTTPDVVLQADPSYTATPTYRIVSINDDNFSLYPADYVGMGSSVSNLIETSEFTVTDGDNSSVAKVGLKSSGQNYLTFNILNINKDRYFKVNAVGADSNAQYGFIEVDSSELVSIHLVGLTNSGGTNNIVSRTVKINGIEREFALVTPGTDVTVEISASGYSSKTLTFSAVRSAVLVSTTLETA